MVSGLLSDLARSSFSSTLAAASPSFLSRMVVMLGRCSKRRVLSGIVSLLIMVVLLGGEICKNGTTAHNDLCSIVSL